MDMDICMHVCIYAGNSEHGAKKYVKHMYRRLVRIHASARNVIRTPTQPSPKYSTPKHSISPTIDNSHHQPPHPRNTNNNHTILNLRASSGSALFPPCLPPLGYTHPSTHLPLSPSVFFRRAITPAKPSSPRLWSKCESDADCHGK